MIRPAHLRRIHSTCNPSLTILLLLTFSCPILHGATFPTGFVGTTVATGFSSPTAMSFAPDGRLFVCEQTGSLRVIKNDILLTKPFLTVTVNSSGERGLLGVTFDPDFSTNHYVYIYYTVPSPTVHNRISRFTADGDTALAGTETVLLNLNDLSATNHNGGAIHFGPDGKLYAGVGENAVGTNAQTLTSLLGKMLRINSDGTIPPDNPFYNTATGDNRAIWAMGLRNPFTFAFKPGSTRLLINDVGQNTWEEINDGIAGSNYGWPTTEGMTNNPNFRGPLFVYNHSSGSFNGCAIVGGAFYTPATVAYPASYVGDYFFADLCNGWIRVFHPADSSSRAFADGVSTPVDLQVSSSGSLYYLYRGGTSGVIRVDYTLPLPIQLVSFTGMVTGGGDVQLTWVTLSEVNNYGFYVQRKRVGESEYVGVSNGFVPGHGTTNEPHIYLFTDAMPGTGAWMYRLKQVDLDGATTYTEPVMIDVPTGIGGARTPSSFALLQNFPNPFNPSTTVEFSLQQRGYATLNITNLLGEIVATLVDGVLEGGYHAVRWDASTAPSGVYFYRLASSGRVDIKKLVLIR